MNYLDRRECEEHQEVDSTVCHTIVPGRHSRPAVYWICSESALYSMAISALN